MAITFYTGIPRSGKSYKAVFTLYENFVQKLPKRPFFVGFFYKLLKRFVKSKSSLLVSLYNFFGRKRRFFNLAYTNINEFDFSCSDRIKFYNHEDIYSKMELLHAMYLCGKNDNEIKVFAKEYKLYNCLFVIDECQNFFSKDDAVLTWWITYHGHLHQDIIFITQNMDLIFKGYFKNAEFFYKAVPPANRPLSNAFLYNQYNSHNLYKSEKCGSTFVPMKQEIFNMYVSGAENHAPSQVKKYFLFFLGFLVVLFIGFILFLSLFNTNSEAPQTHENVEQNKTIEEQPQKTVTQQDKKQTPKDIKEAKKLQKKDDNETKNELFEIRCIDMLCSYKGVDFPKPLLNKLTAKLEPEFIWFFNDGSYIQYFVMLPSDTFDFLQRIEKEKSQKGAYNEKSTKEAKTSNTHMPIAVATHK